MPRKLLTPQRLLSYNLKFNTQHSKLFYPVRQNNVNFDNVPDSHRRIKPFSHKKTSVSLLKMQLFRKNIYKLIRFLVISMKLAAPGCVHFSPDSIAQKRVGCDISHHFD